MPIVRFTKLVRFTGLVKITRLVRFTGLVRFTRLVKFTRFISFIKLVSFTAVIKLSLSPDRVMQWEPFLKTTLLEGFIIPIICSDLQISTIKYLNIYQNLCPRVSNKNINSFGP